MEAPQLPLNSVYTVTRPIPNYNGHIVHRTRDNKPSLAYEFNQRHRPELLRIQQPNIPADKIVAFESAARVLNHENIISVLGPLWTAPSHPLSSGFARDPDWSYSLVYDFAEDGNLEQVFEHAAGGVDGGGDGYLPEGMVWHVCTNVLRALVWLHEGVREKVVLGYGKEGAVWVKVRGWTRGEDDWMPILHRGIGEGNIWFAKRRGREVYGVVKLGGFERVWVGGGTGEGVEEVSCMGEGDGGVEEVREDWEWGEVVGFRRVAENKRPYTIGSELHALGKILFRMMKGEKYPRDEQCQMPRCNCFHVEMGSGEACPHNCVYKDFRFADEFQEGTHKYSRELVEVVKDLLDTKSEAYRPTKAWYTEAWKAYEQWKKGTIEGRAHVDHYDDLLERKREAWRKEEERLREGKEAVEREMRAAGVPEEEVTAAMAVEDVGVAVAMQKWQTENASLLEFQE